MRLGTRFALTLLLLIFPILGLVLFQGLVFEHELMEDTTGRVYNNLAQIAQGMDAEISRVRLIAGTMAFDNGLTLIEQRRASSNPAKTLLLSRAIEAHYANFFSLTRHEVLWLVMFYQGHGMEQIFPSQVLGEESDLRSQGWYKTSLVPDTPAQIIDSLKTDGGNYYQLAVAIQPDRNLGTQIELLYLGLKPDFFNNVLRQLQPEPGHVNAEFYAIINKDGHRLFPANQDAPVADSDLVTLFSQLDPLSLPAIRQVGDRSYLVCAQKLAGLDWTIVFFSDWKRLNEATDRVGSWVLIALAFSTVALGLFIWSSYRSIIRPLGLLVSQIDQYARDANFSPGKPRIAPEFSHVFERFASMTAQIKVLNEAKLQAELAALQFQINPHFLSNTLSSLRFMAMLSKAEGIKNMVENLIKMMEYQLDSPQSLSTVAGELGNIRLYEAIMKVRFGDTFDLSDEVEPGLEQHPLLRMLLQPVVENAIEHGLRGLTRRGKIQIKVARKAERSLVITITDNGYGIDADKLAGLLLVDKQNPEPSSSRHRIGLLNVHQRIRTQFGLAYGLTLSSQKDKGTQVDLHLPLEAKDY